MLGYSYDCSDGHGGDASYLNYSITNQYSDMYFDDSGCLVITANSPNRIVLKMDKDLNIELYPIGPNGYLDYQGLYVACSFMESVFGRGFSVHHEYKKNRVWIRKSRRGCYNFMDEFNVGNRMLIIDNPVIRFDCELQPISGMTEITKEEWKAKMDKKDNVKHRLPKRSKW